MPAMRLPVLLACAVLALLAVSACSDSQDRFRAAPLASEDPEDKAIRQDLEDLANGAAPSDPESSVIYDRAVNNLIMRGVKVETKVIDTLRSHGDRWVRLGCVDVLTAIATKTSIEHLIAVLDDEAPLVAQRADIALRTLTGQRMIAEAGQAKEGQLPAVPPRPAEDKALDAEERIWAAWHAAHKAELKAAWERWWAANKTTFVIK